MPVPSTTLQAQGDILGEEQGKEEWWKKGTERREKEEIHQTAYCPLP